MPIELTDSQIAALIAEPKPAPQGYERKLLNLRPKNAHQGSQLIIPAASGREFEIFLRQGMNPLDFSAILGYHSPSTGKVFRLRRYNGRSHTHTNRIEGISFYDFHIHQATERYQAMGAKEDAYAELCTRFSNLRQALECLMADCGFTGIVPRMTSLFE